MYVVQPCYFIHLKNMRKWLLLFATLVGLHIRKPSLSQPLSKMQPVDCQPQSLNRSNKFHQDFVWGVLYLILGLGGFLRGQGVLCKFWIDLWGTMGRHSKHLQTISTSRRETWRCSTSRAVSHVTSEDQATDGHCTQRRFQKCFSIHWIGLRENHGISTGKHGFYTIKYGGFR